MIFNGTELMLRSSNFYMEIPPEMRSSVCRKCHIDEFASHVTNIDTRFASGLRYTVWQTVEYLWKARNSREEMARDCGRPVDETIYHTFLVTVDGEPALVIVVDIRFHFQENSLVYLTITPHWLTSVIYSSVFREYTLLVDFYSDIGVEHASKP